MIPQPILAIALVLVTLLRVTGWAEEKGTKLPERIDEVLWWLPADTQTVLIAQGPFPFEPADEREEVTLVKSLLQACSAMRSDYAKAVQGRVISLAVAGGRRFRRPKHLGLMPYEGAHIIVFCDDLGAVGETLMESLSQRADKTETLSGRPVMKFEGMCEADIWTLYVTRPKANVLVWATSRAYLSEVLDRMASRAGVRALPEDLPEWRHCDVSRRIWAIRHYDHKDAPDDPSSPLGGEKDATVPDAQAVGFVFALEPGKAHVKYLSENVNALKIAKEFWTDQVLNQLVRPGEPGVVEISVSLDGQEARSSTGTFLFHLMVMLGHGVYL